MKTMLWVLAASAVLGGCGPSSSPGGGEKTAPALIEIDGHAISAQDIRTSIELLPDAPRIALLNDPEALRRYIEEYAHKEMIYREALEQGVDKHEPLRRRLAATEKTLITQYMLDLTLADKVKVTDADLKRYFEEHKQEFTAEDRLKLAHIQFASLADAEAAAARLKRGEDFATLAAELSTDALSKDKGGLLGSVERSKAPSEFAAALAKMRKGEISPPLQSQHGYHLVKLLDIEAGGLVAFDGVREPLRQFLREEKQRKALEEYITTLKKDYGIKLRQAEIERFLKNPSAAP